MDTIGQLQPYAYLVPEKYKSDLGFRVAFKLEGLRILRDQSQVPVELRDELRNFIDALEDE